MFLVNYTSSEGPAFEVVDQIKGLGRKSVAVKADVAVKAELKI